MTVLDFRLRHNKKKLAEEMFGKGFHNLIFVDFSSDKFPAISQSYCEKNPIQPACSFHNYTCSKCHKSFPSGSALKLHSTQYHYHPSKFICNLCNHDYSTKSQLERHKSTYPSPQSHKKHLTDSKRRFLRALALLPQCGTAQFKPKEKETPPTNADYYSHLQRVETVTRLSYASSEIPDDMEGDDSDSSQ